MQKNNFLYIFSAVLMAVSLLSPKQASSREDLLQAPASLHISSNISDGKYSISQIAKISRANGIKVIVLADPYWEKAEYGLRPLQNLLKKSVERNSIVHYGIKRYIKEIEDVQEANPDLVLLPGMEVTPFYFWTGSPWKGDLKLNNWHEQMLIAGMEDVRDYKNIPSISNRYTLLGQFNPFLLWPILIALVGFVCFKKRQVSYTALLGYEWGPYSRKWRTLGLILIGISLIFLMNNFPFFNLKYDQYHLEQGITPYQNIIDYVSERGGITFWAHPEAKNVNRVGDIAVETRPYPYDVLRSRDYTGFALFDEGYKKIGCVNCIWDKILTEYCSGKRRRPVWAIGELDFESSGSLDNYMQILQTVLLVPQLTQADVLQALKKGRMYIVRGQPNFVGRLDQFSIKDNLSSAQGIMGDEIDIKGKPMLNIKGAITSHEDLPIGDVQIRIIRNGDIIETLTTESPFSIEYIDEADISGEKIYYRLEIRHPKKIIITNPIFCKI